MFGDSLWSKAKKGRLLPIFYKIWSLIESRATWGYISRGGRATEVDFQKIKGNAAPIFSYVTLLLKVFKKIPILEYSHDIRES